MAGMSGTPVEKLSQPGSGPPEGFARKVSLSDDTLKKCERLIDSYSMEIDVIWTRVEQAMSRLDVTDVMPEEINMATRVAENQLQDALAAVNTAAVIVKSVNVTSRKLKNTRYNFVEAKKRLEDTNKGCNDTEVDLPSLRKAAKTLENITVDLQVAMKAAMKDLKCMLSNV